MASSSKVLNDDHSQEVDIGKKREGKGCWLDLDLGFGAKTVHGQNSSVSVPLLSNVSPLDTVPQHLELNLGLGFVDDNSTVVTCDTTHHRNSRRSQCGVWFSLRSSVNGDGQELPQLPKAYIRVKDENVTISMVKTYLVKKLGLSNEAEIDIFCAGKKLQSQTLKYVQDAIWLPTMVEYARSRVELIHDSDMSSILVMALYYRRRCLLK